METMDVDHGEITLNPGTSKRLYPISKLTGGRKVASARTAKDNVIDPRLRRRQAYSHPTASGSSGSSWTVKSFHGICAPYNDHANWVQDPFNRKVYMIGGTRPPKKDSDSDVWEMTSDFFCYDTRNMEWEDLTEVLTFREPYDPYSPEEIKRQKRPLPALFNPGCTLWRHQDTSFVFMFGGYDLETETPSSQIIVINLEAREWWHETVSGNPLPRIAPAIVAIANSVYIFGGYRSYDNDPLACYSYSVVELKMTPSGSRWNWTLQDVLYSEPLPAECCIGQAISVYGGKLILLTPGRTNHTDQRLLNFTAQNIFYFRPVEKLFQRVPFLGDAPQNIEWYSIFDLQSNSAISPTSSPTTSAPVITGKRPRGRPRKHPLHVPQEPARAPSSTQVTISALIPPSVVICAWLRKPATSEDEDEDESGEVLYSPEIYHFVFHPEDTCKCLNVKGQISNLKRDFQGCSYVDGHLRVLGNRKTEPYDLTSDKTWNIYIDVPLNI